MSKYNSLKEYIQIKFYDLLVEHVTNYANRKYGSLGYGNLNLLSICKKKVDDLKVSSIQCRLIAGSHIHVILGVSACLVTSGLGKEQYAVDRKPYWFSVQFDVNIQEKFDIDEASIKATDYITVEYDRNTSLNEFFLPYVYGDDLEELASDFTLFYCQDAVYNGYSFPVDCVLRNMELVAMEADLPEKTMGRMYFKEGQATVYRSYPFPGGKWKTTRYENETVKARTILINKSHYFMGKVGSKILTLAHELVHWEYHQNFFKILSLLDEDADSMSCMADPTRLDEDMSALEKAKWFAEWQANALAIRIALPEAYFDKAIQEAYAASSGAGNPFSAGYEADRFEDTIRRVGELFGVSPYIAKQRAIQVGYDIAEGTYVYVDGKYYQPFYFKQFTLEKHQTFIISKDALNVLSNSNPVIKSLIDSGKFVYTGHLLCVNDSKYIRKIDETDIFYTGHEYALTEYARGHVDECCLVFNWSSSFEFKDSGDFYGQCYLSKNVCAEGRVEYHYNPFFENNQKTEEMKLEIEKLKEEFDNEDRVMKELPNSFDEALIYHMKRRGVTVEELAHRANLSEKTIKMYRAGKEEPRLESLMAIFIGLQLKEQYCDHMLELLCYSLRDMDNKQKVYRYLIRNHMDSNLEHWNQILKMFELPTIPKKNILTGGSKSYPI